MQALLFLTSITFLLVVGAAIIRSIAFYRRYRVRLQVTPKGSSHHSLDLEAYDPERNQSIQPPQPVHQHSRSASRHSRGPAYTERRWQSSRTMPDYHYVPYRIPEEADTGSINYIPHILSQTLPATPTPLATATAPPEAPAPVPART